MNFFDQNIQQLKTISFAEKSSILKVRLDSKYNSSIEFLLDRFGKSKNFRKKRKNKFRDIQ